MIFSNRLLSLRRFVCDVDFDAENIKKMGMILGKGVLRYLHKLENDSNANKLNFEECENTESVDQVEDDLVSAADLC